MSVSVRVRVRVKVRVRVRSRDGVATAQHHCGVLVRGRVRG